MEHNKLSTRTLCCSPQKYNHSNAQQLQKFCEIQITSAPHWSCIKKLSRNKILTKMLTNN